MQAAEDREDWQQAMLGPLVDGSALAQLDIVTGSDSLKSMQVYFPERSTTFVAYTPQYSPFNLIVDADIMGWSRPNASCETDVQNRACTESDIIHSV